MMNTKIINYRLVFEMSSVFLRRRLSAKALHARRHSRRLALDSTPVSRRVGGRERAHGRFHTRRESGRGTRSRSSPAPTGEVADRPPSSRAAACGPRPSFPNQRWPAASRLLCSSSTIEREIERERCGRRRR